MKTNTKGISMVQAQSVVSLFAVSMLMSYAYLLCTAVTYAVQQKDLSFQSAQVVESLAVLEAEYLQKTSNLTQKNATELGLVAIVAKEYARADLTLGRATVTTTAN
jgi:hypothetical protein